MRQIVLCIALLTQLAFAREKNWQDAVFLGINSTQSGTFAAPIGTAIIAGPITSSHFWFQADGLVYCLWFPPRLSGRIPLLTVNGHTKFAVDGGHVFIMDDSGKQWKLRIVEKVAPKPR